MQSGKLITSKSRVAAHYWHTLGNLEAAYRAGGDAAMDALSQFDVDWLQIKTIYAWIKEAVADVEILTVPLFTYPLTAELLQLQVE